MDPSHMLPAPKAHTIFFNKQKAYILLGIIVSILILIFSIQLATTRTSWFGRAASPGASGILSLTNSYLFASPIRAAADGNSIIRITVFLLTTEGLGISGQEVKLKLDKALIIDPVQPVTDTFGRSMFDVTSKNQGNYTIAAEAQGAPLPQMVSILYQ